MSAAVEKSVIYRRNEPGTKREEWCKWPEMAFDEVCAFRYVYLWSNSLYRNEDVRIIC